MKGLLRAEATPAIRELGMANRPGARTRPNPAKTASETRSQSAEAATLGRIGSLEVRLATKPVDLKRAQRLRFKVFYKEMEAVANPLTLTLRRDIDAFDRICDHLLVLDHDEKEIGFRGQPKVVGTYRLLRQEVAESYGGFYTSSEYDIDALLTRHPDRNFLELGRSCVLKPYRNKRTVELLWHGIWSYVLRHGIDVMVGCASLNGTDPDALATPLSFLHHHALASKTWRARAIEDRYVAMDRIAKHELDVRAAMKSLPPLLKGYLRLGARFGDGAVVDWQFGTTDVLVILPVSQINPRYVNYYGEDAGRYAADRAGTPLVGEDVLAS